MPLNVECRSDQEGRKATMPEADVAVARVVVDGRPIVKSGEDNFRWAQRMLLQAFEDNRWPGRALFAVTPGGFVSAPFPDDWKGRCGWSSRSGDFRALLGCARKAVAEVLTRDVLNAARGRAQFLTLGVDLNDRSGKRKMDRLTRGTHAELVAIIDVESREPARWTGKSYPVSWQERTLVHEADLKSHLFCFGDQRVLVLGCHDLNMFSARSKANLRVGSERYRRATRMRRLAKSFKPTIILHHAHSTDSPRIWSTSWSGARELLPSRAGVRHVWASGIGYYNGDDTPRGALCDVRRSTRCCEEHVVDVCVDPSR